MYIDPSQNTRIFMKVQLLAFCLFVLCPSMIFRTRWTTWQNVACKDYFLGQAGLDKVFLSHTGLKSRGGTRNRRKKPLDIALYLGSAPNPIFLILVYLPGKSHECVIE